MTVRVMVVDDHPMWRDGVARDLTEAGYLVTAAVGEGAQAVRVAAAADRNSVHYPVSVLAVLHQAPYPLALAGSPTWAAPRPSTALPAREPRWSSGFPNAERDSTFLVGKYVPEEEVVDVPPIDAELALAEMRARREQVVDTNLVPRWFWPAVGALMLLFTGAVESGVGWLIAAGTMAYVLGLAAVIVAVVRKARVQVRTRLIGAHGILVILAFAAVLVLAGLGLGFTLEALSVPFPATVAIVPVAVAMTLGGPVLMGYLRRLMLSRPLAGTR